MADLVARIRDLGNDYVLQVEGPKTILSAEKVMRLRVPYDPLNPENPATVGVYTHSPDEKSDRVAVTFLIGGTLECEALLSILHKKLQATIEYHPS